MLILLTGATDGIGRALALALARRGATVIIHGRNAARAREVHEALEASSRAKGGRAVPEPVLADFSSLEAVREMARELERRSLAPEMLINNAGAAFPERGETSDGFERTFAINHLAPLLLSLRLLQSSSSRDLRRIVNVSSMAQRNGEIDLDDLQWQQRRYEAYRVYAATKLANVMTTQVLAEALEPLGITVNAMHPGVASTTLLREGFGAGGFESVDECGERCAALVLSDELGSTTGRYFQDGERREPNALAADHDLVRRFYAASLEMIGEA